MINPPGRKWPPLLIIPLALSVFWTILVLRSEPETESIKSPTLSIRHEYGVVTQNDLTAWPPGTLLDPGMAAYFYAANPLLQVTSVTELFGLDDGSLSGFIDTGVMIRAIDDKSRIYWTYALAGQDRQDLSLHQGDRTASVTFDPIDMTAVYGLVSKINEELAFHSGMLQMVVTSKIHLKGTVNGIPVDKSIALESPFLLQQAGFSAPGSNDLTSENPLAPATATSSQTTLSQKARENPFPFLLDGILLFALVVLLLRKNAAKPDAEHRRYKEWITEGIVEVRDKTAINILSLEGLVDLAIDLDKRVIFDSKAGKYFVLTEDLIYVYDPGHSRALTENRPQLGRMLLEQGLIGPEQLEIGLHYQKKIGGRLGESLTALGFIDETTLYAALAAQQNMDFYEPDPAELPVGLDWHEKLSLNRARAMMVLPLGKRSDGELVVACGEIPREGFRDALEETLETKIHLVVARPSAIYQVLEQLEKHLGGENHSGNSTPGDAIRLTLQERERFIASYARGILVRDLLIKASGLNDSDVARGNVGRDERNQSNRLPAELSNLVNGLGKAIKAMDRKAWQNRRLPTLLNLLQKSNYLSPGTMDWVQKEAALQEIPEEKFLRQNSLVSEKTIKNALFLIGILESILSPDPS